jgi:hypothetical protein
MMIHCVAIKSNKVIVLPFHPKKKKKTKRMNFKKTLLTTTDFRKKIYKRTKTAFGSTCILVII